MPRVPTYDNFQTRPGLQPQVEARVPNAPDVAGRQMAQMGQAVQSLGGEAGRIALDMQQQANQVKLNDAMNKAMQAQLRLTFDPAEGYTHLRGDAALTRPDGKALPNEFDEKLGKSLDEIEGTLGNEAQKTAFRQQAGQLRAQFQGKVTAHMAKEFGDYQISVQDGTIATARDQMALAWGDAGAVQQSTNAIKAAVAEKGRLQGWSAQQVEAGMREVLSPGHASVVASAVDAGKLDYAREYFKQVGAELTPQARLQLTKVLDAGDFEARTQDAADRLLAKHEGDAAAALAEVRATMSGKDEDATVQRIKAIDGERVQMRERVRREAYGVGRNLMAQGKAVPPSIMTAMGDEHAAQIREAQQARAKAAAAEKPIKTDWPLYLQLREKAVADPQGFAADDLTRYVDRIGPAQLEQLADIRAALGNAASKGKARDAATLTQQMNATMQALGVKDAKVKGQFLGYVQSAADDAMQAQGGKPLSFDQRQKIIDEAVLRGPDPDAWFFGQKYQFQLSPEQRTRFKPNAPAAPAPVATPVAGPQPAAGLTPVQLPSDAAAARAAFAALPSGAQFIDPNGVLRTKP